MPAEGPSAGAAAAAETLEEGGPAEAASDRAAAGPSVLAAGAQGGVHTIPFKLQPKRIVRRGA